MIRIGGFLVIVLIKVTLKTGIVYFSKSRWFLGSRCHFINVEVIFWWLWWDFWSPQNFSRSWYYFFSMSGCFLKIRQAFLQKIKLFFISTTFLFFGTLSKDLGNFWFRRAILIFSWALSKQNKPSFTNQ